MGLAGALSAVHRMGQIYSATVSTGQNIEYYMAQLRIIVAESIQTTIKYGAVKNALLNSISSYTTSNFTGYIVISYPVVSAVDHSTIADLASLHETGWTVRKHAYIKLETGKKIPLYNTGVAGSHFAEVACGVFNTLFAGQAVCSCSHD